MRLHDFCPQRKGGGPGVRDRGVDSCLRDGAIHEVAMNDRHLLGDARLDVSRLPDQHHNELVLALRVKDKKIGGSYLVDVRHTNSEVTGDGGGLGLGAGVRTRALLDLLEGVEDLGRLPLALVETGGDDSAIGGLDVVPGPESPSPSGSTSGTPSSLGEAGETPYKTCERDLIRTRSLQKLLNKKDVPRSGRHWR